MQIQTNARSRHVPTTDLVEAIQRQVFRRTWGRIHRLGIELLGDRIVVHGRTSTYHSKQLALEGVLDVLGPNGTAAVELDIEVTTVQ